MPELFATSEEAIADPRAFFDDSVASSPVEQLLRLEGGRKEVAVGGLFSHICNNDRDGI